MHSCNFGGPKLYSFRQTIAVDADAALQFRLDLIPEFQARLLKPFRQVFGLPRQFRVKLTGLQGVDQGPESSGSAVNVSLNAGSSIK